MRGRGLTEARRRAGWVNRTAPWMLIVVLSVLFAADRLGAPDGAITALVVIGLITLVIDVVVFLRTPDRDT